MNRGSGKVLGPVDITSFMVLLVAAVFFFYSVIDQNADRSMKRFRNLSKTAESQLVKANPKGKKPEENHKAVGNDRKIISDVPTFLEMLNTKLAVSGLELDTIKKSEDNDYTYEFITYATFGRLLNFLYKTEQSNLVIQDLDIHPYSGEKHLINIKLQLIQDKMNTDDLRSFDTFQRKYGERLRDPFQKEALVQVPKDTTSQKPSTINLTWKYRLTGIGFDKGRYATIDHNNYYEKDVFNGMRITQILSDRVHLASKDAKTKYLIAFRYKRRPKDK